MPNEGDAPGPCCEAMRDAVDSAAFPIRWCRDEMNIVAGGSFTGWGMEVDATGWYPGEHFSEYAPVKFCPFCGAELKG